jgi:opacity protein-like surface antigen
MLIKNLSIALLAISAMGSAQIKFAAKANLVFKTDSPSWQNLQNSAVSAYNESGKNNVGFNAGLSAKINLPVSLFLMPEIYYTTFKTEFTVPGSNNTTIEAKSNRIDVPVLLGLRILGDNLGLFVGPVASYNLSKDNQYQDFKENAANNFTVGYQFGAQVQLKKIIVNARYEGAFSDDQRDFFNSNNTNETIRYDARPSLFSVGLGYEF